MTLSELPSLLAKLVAVLIWRIFRRLPLDLTLAVAGCSVIGAVAWWALLSDYAAPSVAAFAGMVSVVCYAIAALLWGLHRALRAGTLHALDVYETQTPKFLDLILDLLIERVPLGEQKISIVEARVLMKEYVQAPVAVQSSSRWLAWVSRAAGRIACWVLRRQLAVAETLLARLEERGETHLTPMSLKDYLRDQTINLTITAARARIRIVEFSVAAAVFLLLVIPAGLTRLI